jgi:hypothetical protein
MTNPTDPAAVEAWETYGPAIFHCGMTGPQALQSYGDQRAADERAAVVAWMREQEARGAEYGLAADKGTTRRAAFGGGSLALKRAADSIEDGDHLKGAGE